MSPLSCPDVDERIELYAADECEPAEAEAIRRHLAHCPRCAAACAEARQLVGLLDLRLQEPERLRRLEARLAREAQPRRRVLRFPGTLRRVVSLAAMLLLTVGLVGWLTPRFTPEEGDGGLVVALREESGRDFSREAMQAPAMAPDAERRFAKEDRLPPVLEADRTLQLRNDTDRPMQVWVAGPHTELHFDLTGPRVVSLPVKDGTGPGPPTVTLRPGESRDITIHSPAPEAWSRIEPGDYTLTARLTTMASSPGTGARRITARSAPVPIHVGGK
jgi:hypothetical protein